MHELLPEVCGCLCGQRTASAFDPKRDNWQRKKVKIFVTICADAVPFYSAALIPDGLFQTERQC
jgi:hypothetical protein